MTIVLGIAAVLTAILSGVIGMGGGVTLLAVMTFFLNPATIIPIHGVVQLTSNSTRALFLRHHVVWKYFIPFALGTPFGAFIAFKVLQTVTHKSLFIIPLITIILYVLFKPKKLPHIKIEQKGFFILGIFTAFAAPLMGATGPLLAAFFLRDDLEKEEIVATKASVQILTHLLKIPLFLSLSFPYQDHLPLIGIMCAGAIIGTKIGTYLLGKITPSFFVYLYKTFLFLALIRLISKLFIN